MYRTMAFQRVYWGGAAIALMADVEIRAHSDGHRTLESALRGMDPFATRTLRADEVMARIDRAVGAPIFSGVARRWLSSREAPDPTDVYRRLGIVREGEGVRLVDGPDSEIRDAIMAGSPGGSPAR
jgi:predicted metalloprotease with PDZ domain